MKISDISNIITSFRSNSLHTDSEVTLFRELAKTLTAAAASTVFIDETHGAQKANVTYSNSQQIQTRCEISDLLIITRGATTPHLTATFWQAKKCKKSDWVNYNTADAHLDFEAQFNQWELLSSRPNLTAIPPFSAPSNILSSFNSPAIATYGVFYEKNGQIEVAHSIAELIACTKPKKIPKQNTKCIINAFLACYQQNAQEVCVKTDMESFLTALLTNRIGAPIDNMLPAHQWLISYAASKLNFNQETVKNDFFEGFSVDIDINYEADGLSILFIDARDYPELYV